MAVPSGWVFDRRTEVRDRLQQGPGEEARQEVAPTVAGPPPSRWTLRGMRATFDWLKDYTERGVWRMLQRCDLRLRSARVCQYSPDPEYQAKETRLLACLRAAAQRPTEVVVLFLDAMGYYRWPEPAASWSLDAPVPPPVAHCAGLNNKQWRVIGALNARTGRVDYLENYIVGRRQVIQFYHQLDCAYPDAHHLYVVQDNWSIHQHDEVLAALQGLPRIEPVWLPTYAPWLNPIEKLWRWLRQQQLYLHRLADDWELLRQRVNAFLDQFATGSHALLQYVGLMGEGKLAQALRGA